MNMKLKYSSVSWPLALLLALVTGSNNFASALPSFGTRFPNGQIIPCPPNGEGCIAGICRGVGHPTCSGGISGASPQLLNPFGEDFRDAGFLWTPELCQKDSDGDGLTNGEELGDPCCVWSVAGSVLALAGEEGEGVAPYTANFTPTHPGEADHVQEDYVRPECGTADTSPSSFVTDDADQVDNEDDGGTLAVNGISGYRPGEERASFDLIMEPYLVPSKTTTYVDMLFNLPEDLPGLFHIVYGEAIVSQPRHLHHFVVTGCSERVPPEQDGRPVSEVPDTCNLPVGGFAGWAPGATLWGFNKDVGTPIGEDFGIVALQVNVHYTDGEAPYLNGEQAIATDGIRIHYTPTLRPKTATATPVINVGSGPEEMFVEPQKERVFMTRTCTVQSRCTDTPDDDMSRLGGWLGDPSMTCASGKAFCAAGAELDFYKLACPITCGLCSEDEVSPRNPGEYNAIGVYYHAHLLGTEMYTTLTPADDPDARIDLKSMPAWTYEDQPIYPLELTVRPGDKIQTTCIFNSMSRDENTPFDISTYEEMCLNTVVTVLETPALAEDGGDISPAMDIRLRGFSCESSPAADIWMGELTAEDDGLLVADLHPLADVECSFPTSMALLDGTPSYDRRCNGELIGEEDLGGLCDRFPGSRLMGEESAGANCSGGTLNMGDSNDGTTEEQCTDGGGSWRPYTCGQADELRRAGGFKDFGADMEEYILKEWFAPKCCADRGNICDHVPSLSMNDNANAGASCSGGTLDTKDSNDGTTEEQCIGGGGTWSPYTCSQINYYLRQGGFDMVGEEVEKLLVESWYAPKCCVVTETDEVVEEETANEEEPQDDVQDATNEEEPQDDAQDATNEEEPQDDAQDATNEEEPQDNAQDVEMPGTVVTTPSSAVHSAAGMSALATLGCIVLLTL